MESKLICLIALLGLAAVADTQTVEDLLIQILSAPAKGQVATIPELITRNRYSAETHHVVTQDGYILEMHRIPASPVSPPADNKPVVFLMHGLLCGSDNWVVAGPGRGLGYLLADAGYDVWMGNARGNTWSRNHTSAVKPQNFWDFSWHEIGYYDVPAMIDFALNRTGQRQVIYVGVSQGTTAFYVMASMRSEYNRKIKAMFSLAPVAYMGHLFSPVLRALSPGAVVILPILDTAGFGELLPSGTWLSKVGAFLCANDVLSQALCHNLLFILAGFDEDQMDKSLLPTILQYVPAGASVKQLIHYCQEILSGKFRRYDFGPLQNLLTYGRLTPPDYDLSKITAPVHLIYATNDWLSAVTDVTRLYNELGNPKEMRKVPFEKWNHLDYVSGIDAKKYVYDNIMDTMRTHYSN